MSSSEAAETAAVSFRASLPLDGAALADVRARLRSYLAARGVDAREAAAVVLCVEEAAANAIRHSHGRQVDVAVWADAHGVYARVCDDGVGFSHVERPCPDPWATRGRGLYLVRSLMDDVLVDCSQGALVAMHKRLDGDAARGA